MKDFQTPAEPVDDGNNSILSLQAGMTSDNRVKITVVLHEEFSKPNLSLQLLDKENCELARSYIINVIDQQTDFTLHIRQPLLKYPLRLRCESFKIDGEILDSEEIFLDQ